MDKNNKIIRYALTALVVIALGFTAINKIKNGESLQELKTEFSQQANSQALTFTEENKTEEEAFSQLEQIQEQSAVTENKTEESEASSTAFETEAKSEQEDEAKKILKNGSYSSKDDVALYIYTYSTLPENFITKKEAQALGWTGGSLEPYAKGKSIGGDRFGNYEGNLPKKSGRQYTECDIDTKGKKSRGAKRIVFSNDGLIYYTEDHYQTFTLLYDKDGKK